MAKKSIGAVLTLKDGNFRTNLRQSILGFDQFREASKRAGQGTNAFEKAIQRGDRATSKLIGTVKGMVGAAVGYLAINSMTTAIKSYTAAAQASERANDRLETLMKNVPGTTAAGVKGIQNEAGALTKLGVVGKGVAVSGASQLATFQLQSSTIKQLLPGFEDLLVSVKGVNATQEDAIGIGNLLGKAMTGNVGALTRYGVTLTDTQKKILKSGTEQQRLAVITAALKSNFGGLNEATAKTSEGGVARLKNNLAALKATIGAQLLPIMAQGVKYITDNLPQIQTILQQVTTGGIDVVKAALPAAVSLFKGLASVVSWTAKNSGTLKSGLGFVKDMIIATSPVLASLTAGYVAYKAVLIATTIIQNAHKIAVAASTGVLALQCAALEYQTVVAGGGSKAMALITAAQWLWNYAMDANPIGAVIIGVAALTAGIIVLVKHWDSVTAAIKRAWEWLTKWKGVKSSGTSGMADFKKLDAGHNALGTSYWKGGLTWVGENGPELANIPKGTKIHSNSQSAAITNNRNQPNITININGANLTTKQVINELVPQLKLALANM